MKIDTIQTSFVGGELAPSLFGRTDVAQYGNGLATLENMIIRPAGSVISCPGTEFINECKTGGSTSIVRLLQFTFSRTDAYVIEMGVGYFRFYTQGAVLCSTGTTPYEVSHTYTAAQLRELDYRQINDVVHITHKDHVIRTLTRYGSVNWQLADVTITGGPFMPDNTTATTITPSATSGTITLSASSAIFTPSGSTLGHVNSYWRIGGTVTDSTTGLDVQGYVKITAITNPSTATATVMKTLKSSVTTVDWAEGSWSAVRGNPARVAFHQQRIFYARTNAEPQTVWGSKSFVYTDFALDGQNDDDALNLPLGSDEANDIKWLISGKALIAGTYGGAFVIKSGDDSPLTPSNANAYPDINTGSDPIKPQRIGNFFYYVQRFGKKLRELFYFWNLDTYKAVDKTILSKHITSDGIVDMAYQQDPDTILHCVTTNGTIATMTREVDQEIQGWSRQTTDGYYEAIATIPSQQGPYDEVWVVVRRTINGVDRRYIERFAAIDVPDVQDLCWYVHSGLYYSAYETTGASGAKLSLSATAGTSVVITSSTSAFSTDDVGQRVRAIDADGTILGELRITGYTSGTIVIGTVKLAFDAQSYEAGHWGVSVNDLIGLNHLEAKTVSSLVDGGTSKPNQVVSNGTITLPYDGFYVIVGLPRTEKLTTLPQEAGSQRGTSQGKKQRISEVGFKVNHSHKGFYVGGSAAPKDRIQFRDPSTLMGTPEQLFTGTIPNINPENDWVYGAQLYIENRDPLPIEILSIMTAIETADK